MINNGYIGHFLIAIIDVQCFVMVLVNTAFHFTYSSRMLTQISLPLVAKAHLG